MDTLGSTSSHRTEVCQQVCAVRCSHEADVLQYLDSRKCFSIPQKDFALAPPLILVNHLSESSPCRGITMCIIYWI
jgi:hypothetical protein